MKYLFVLLLLGCVPVNYNYKPTREQFGIKQCRIPIEVSFNDGFQKLTPNQVRLVKDSLRWWESYYGTLLFVEVPFIGVVTFENTDVPYFGNGFSNTKNFWSPDENCILSSQIVFYQTTSFPEWQQRAIMKREVGHALGFTDQQMVNFDYMF